MGHVFGWRTVQEDETAMAVAPFRLVLFVAQRQVEPRQAGGAHVFHHVDEQERAGRMPGHVMAGHGHPGGAPRRAQQ